ncbi:MAG: hypothetical protein KME45_33565 [Stenomitos rutilans HA7619-LM2]|nr:hypothetical protein [Stenomitos rutilans HA7619-LM2]
MELKLLAAKLLQGYDWSLLPQDLTLVTVPTPDHKEQAFNNSGISRRGARPAPLPA